MATFLLVSNVFLESRPRSQQYASISLIGDLIYKNLAGRSYPRGWTFVMRSTCFFSSTSTSLFFCSTTSPFFWSNSTPYQKSWEPQSILGECFPTTLSSELLSRLEGTNFNSWESIDLRSTPTAVESYLSSWWSEAASGPNSAKTRSFTCSIF